MKKIVCFLLLLAMAVGGSGCIKKISTPAQTGQEEESLKIAVYTDSPGGDAWRQISAGIEAEESVLSEEAEVVYIDRAEDAKTVGADVILIYSEAGLILPETDDMRVVYVELGAQYGDVPCVKTDYAGAGKAAAEAMAADLAKREVQAGKLVVLASQTDAGAGLACQGFISAAEAGKYRVEKDMKLCAGEEDVAAILDTVEEGNAVVGIFAADTAAAEALIKYIQANGLEDKISVISLGCNEGLYKAMRMGALYGAMLPNLPEIGKAALNLAVCLVKGEDVSGLSFSKSEEIPSVLIDRSNIDDPLLRLLQPPVSTDAA